MSSPKLSTERTHLSLRGVLGVAIALWALTALTYALSRLPHGAWSLAVALGIAAVKATLIVLFYMHWVEQRGSKIMTQAHLE